MNVAMQEIEELKDLFCEKARFNIAVLDRGFVKLVDFCGSDRKIEQAARQSYGQGTRQVNDTVTLLNYLMRHHHSSPFEMADITLQIKCPIFVARQWVRHRTHSMNEYSARYSQIMDEFYVPDLWRVQQQASDNKQGSAEDAIDDACDFIAHTQKHNADVIAAYKHFDGCDLARELNRINVPVSNYTVFTWKQNLHNMFHFLRLRLDEHAQYEIRVYAQAMASIIQDLFPVSYEAFTKYRLNSETFSERELVVVRLLAQKGIDHDVVLAADNLERTFGLRGREQTEFLKKINQTGDR